MNVLKTHGLRTNECQLKLSNINVTCIRMEKDIVNFIHVKIFESCSIFSVFLRHPWIRQIVKPFDPENLIKTQKKVEIFPLSMKFSQNSTTSF